jgi:hypothetical protein
MNTIARAYQLFCKERFPLPSEEELADLESRLGVRLPADYRQFLLDYNGGLFDEPEIAPPSDACPSELGVPGGYTPAIFDDNDPPQLLPIGYTVMGNLIFLVTDPTGNDRGRVGMKLASQDTSFNFGEGIEEFFARLRRSAFAAGSCRRPSHETAAHQAERFRTSCVEIEQPKPGRESIG